jgi:hypothetical protein
LHYKGPWSRTSGIVAIASSRARVTAVHEEGSADRSTLLGVRSSLDSAPGTHLIPNDVAYRKSSVERGSGRLHTQPIACSPRRSPRTSPCSLGTASKAAFCSGQWHARSDDARVHVPRGGARRSTCVASDPWKHLNAVRRHRCGSRTEAPETWAPNGQQRTDRNDRLWMQCLRMNQKQ